MKQAMSAFDLRAVAAELRTFVGSFVKKSYMPHYEQVVLRMNPKDGDAFDLVIVRGRRISISRRDRPMPQSPPPFAMLLRKELGNARLTAVEQVAFDRLLRLSFSTKGGDRHLMVECFGDGNVILLDENDVIIQPLTHASYRDRTLKRGEAYQTPPPAVDPHDLTVSDLASILMASERNLASTLGGQVNLGGRLANAVCAAAGLDADLAAVDVAPEAVHGALRGLLDALAASDSGVLVMKEGASGEAPTSQGDLDLWLLDHVDEASPVLLPDHVERHHLAYPTLLEAVDAWWGGHDADALLRREMEQVNAAAPGRGHSTDVERLERRLAQQEQALEGFHEKVEKQQALGHAIQAHWSHIDGILTQTRQAVEQRGWDGVRAAINGIPWITKVDPAERTLTCLLPDEDGRPSSQQVLLHLDESVHQNAQRHFETGRRQKDKSSGAIEALEETRLQLERAKKKEAKQQASGQVVRVKRAKRLWFEHHRWTMLPNGRLLVGGRDAKGNDAIVKKHLKGEDRYLHADLHGAPSCALQSQRGFVVDERPPAYLPEGLPAFRLTDRLEVGSITEEDLADAARLALCWSRAWGSGGAHGTVYSVKPAQVSKTAETGEFVGAGAFIVRGQRTWYKDLDMRLGLVLIAINGVPLLLGTTPEHASTLGGRWAVVSGGRTKKEQAANRIAKATGLSVDDILPVLPGALDVVDDHDLFTAKVRADDEEDDA
jgi:predicted ribosome quality control (RQC) complex YloA/Tae2 family protein